MLLSIRNLSISFEGTCAVQELDLDLQRGSVTALVGESGCGKTVTALAIGGIQPASACVTADSIRFNDTDLASLTAAEMRTHRGASFAYIFQEPMTSLNPVLRVGTQLTEVMRAHGFHNRGANKKKALDLLEKVQFADPHRVFDSYPHQLSGGMRQRVMIAMALMLDPALLIADEPTTALDVTVQREVLRLLNRLRRQLDLTILLITHDLEVVSSFADETVVMYAGQVIEKGRTGELLKAPAHPYTQGLLLSSPSRQTRGQLLHFIPGTVAIRSINDVGCSFRQRCPLADQQCTDRTPLPASDIATQPRCHYPLKELNPQLWQIPAILPDSRHAGGC